MTKMILKVSMLMLLCLGNFKNSWSQEVERGMVHNLIITQIETVIGDLEAAMELKIIKEYNLFVAQTKDAESQARTLAVKNFHASLAALLSEKNLEKLIASPEVRFIPETNNR